MPDQCVSDYADVQAKDFIGRIGNKKLISNSFSIDLVHPTQTHCYLHIYCYPFSLYGHIFLDRLLSVISTPILAVYAYIYIYINICNVYTVLNKYTLYKRYI